MSQKKRFPTVPTDDLTEKGEPGLEPGTLVDDKYRVVRKLGEGTVGQVYEAVHSLIGYRVALKVLSSEMALRRDALMLLLHEARVANTIRHPNIVTMMDLAQTRNGVLYLVMELLEGEDLGQHFQRKGVYARLDSIPLVDQICAGLSAAHADGVYHRDLKPQNLFVVRPDDRTPSVKILDFGLSRVSRPGTRSLWYRSNSQFVGTPLYCAPELIRGDGQADHRADVYSLGVLLYQMWTGRVPFDSPSISEVLRMQEHDLPPRPSLVRPGMTEQTERILQRALAKDPKDRYQTVDELRMDLDVMSPLPRAPKLRHGHGEG